MIEINDKLAGEERTPFTNVFLQEIERMNVLLEIMKISLWELNLGLAGALLVCLDSAAFRGFGWVRVQIAFCHIFDRGAGLYGVQVTLPSLTPWTA